MTAHDPPDASHPATTPGASSVVPTGTNAVVVHSDLRCPWAHVAVHRLLAAVDGQGMGSELVVDHRWFPLGDDAIPDDAAALDRKLAPLAALEPELRWHGWADGDATFPSTSRPAAAWVQGAKQVSPAASTALDRALRLALFADGRDISDQAVLAAVASSVAGLDVDAVTAEVESGRPDAELERQAELSESDLVPASPTIVLSDGTRWTNPGIEFHVDDGRPVVDADEPAVYDEIIDAYLAQRHYD